MLVLGSGTQPAGPDIVSLLSYYANDAVWAWNAAWSFSADKLRWGIPVALLSALIVAAIARWWRNGDWRRGLIAGIVAAVVAPLLALSGICATKFIQYPIIHEAELHRPHRLGLGAAYGIFYALQGANLKVPGKWNVVFTGPGESGAIQSDIRQILLMAVPGVLFPEVPVNSNNLDAPPLPEPPEQPGITIHGSNALAHALGPLGGCFVTRTTSKMVDGFEQFYGIENLVWIEIGHGSPWRDEWGCSE
jgi:hypothetical protein